MEFIEYNIKSDLLKILSNEKKKLNAVKAKLDLAPAGTMRKRVSHGYNTYYILSSDESGKKHDTILGKKNPELFCEYARKLYYEQLYKTLLTEIKTIESFISGYFPEKKYEAFSTLDEKIAAWNTPVFLSDNELISKWEKSDYKRNNYPIEINRYVSAKGECVRSRIELITANLLNKLCIPYRYECELIVQSKAIYPDFTVLHPRTLEMYYIEIFGMMDDEKYAAKAFQKINEYGKAGLFPKLIPLFDSALEPITTPALEQILVNTFNK